MPFDNKPLFPDKEVAAVQKHFDGLSAQDLEKKVCVCRCVCVCARALLLVDADV